jgi:hypothetical protein
LSKNPSPDFAIEEDVIEVKLSMLIGLIVAVALAALFLVLRL